MKKSIKEFIGVRRSKMEVEKFVRSIDQKGFDELISFCFGKDPKLAERASWPVSNCVELHPEWAKKHIRKIIRQLSKPSHNSVRRNLARLLQFIDVPKSLHAETISTCFVLLNNKEEFVAVKVFSMEQIGKLCRLYPELKDELKAAIDAQYDLETPAFRARARNVLKGLEKFEARKIRSLKT